MWLNRGSSCCSDKLLSASVLQKAKCALMSLGTLAPSNWLLKEEDGPKGTFEVNRQAKSSRPRHGPKPANSPIAEEQEVLHEDEETSHGGCLAKPSRKYIC